MQTTHQEQIVLLQTLYKECTDLMPQMTQTQDRTQFALAQLMTLKKTLQTALNSEVVYIETTPTVDLHNGYSVFGERSVLRGGGAVDTLTVVRNGGGYHSRCSCSPTVYQDVRIASVRALNGAMDHSLHAHRVIRSMVKMCRKVEAYDNGAGVESDEEEEGEKER